MEFLDLNKNERKLLLTALGVNVNKKSYLKCDFCGNKVHYEKCSIMPSLTGDEKPIILCESILCMSEYLEESEEKSEKDVISKVIKKDVISKVIKKDGQSIEVCSWENYENLIKIILNQLNKKYKNVYGIPRGGLIGAVLISHQLNIPLITNDNDITKKTLIVDDICDSGKTLRMFIHKIYPTTKEIDVAVLHLKYNSKFKPTFYGKKLETDNWIKYPYEK